jgi:hypothetical protein
VLTDDDHMLTARIPRQLLDAVQILSIATQRSQDDVVSSALRTYLADQRRRETVERFFREAQSTFPRAFCVTATVRLLHPLDAGSQVGLERTLGEIDRYMPSTVSWESANRFVASLGVSGRDAHEAASTARKMLLNRVTEEHGLGLADDQGVRVDRSEPLPTRETRTAR